MRRFTQEIGKIPERVELPEFPDRLELDKPPLSVSTAFDSGFLLVGSKGGIIARYDRDTMVP